MAGDPDTFRVSPSLTGMPQLSAAPVESAGPQQMQRLGQAVQGAGQQAASIFTDVLKEQNQTRVADALTKLTERRNKYTYDPDNGWASLTGKNAVERPGGKMLDEEFGGLLDDDAEKLAMELGNDAQRRDFQQRAQAMSQDFRQRVGAHAAAQSRQYTLDTFAGQAATGVNQMSLARTPEELAEAKGMTSAALDRLFELQGAPEEARQEVMQKTFTPAHLAQISRMSEADDVEAAEAYFEANREEMTVDAATRVESMLIEQRTIIDAYDSADAIFDGVTATAAAAEPQDVGMPIIGAFRQTGSFGEKRPGHRHGGIDMALPKGTPVRAGAGGVARVKNDPDGYGTYIDLKMDDGTTLRMAHLDGADVQDGQRVNKGDVIGRSGSSGRSTGPHLHYEVIGPDGTKRDPLEYHQSNPKAPGRVAAPQGGTWAQIEAGIIGQNLPPKTEKLMLERARMRFQSQKEAKAEAEDDLISTAYADVDSRGDLTPAMRSRLVSAGLGANIPALRSFAKSKQERAAGGEPDDTTSLATYAVALEGISSGQITKMEQLFPYVPGMKDGHAKQLVDMLGKPEAIQSAADVQKRAESLFGPEMNAAGLFGDKNGKIDPNNKSYQRFRGAVYRQIQAELAANGGKLSDERLREVVLGMTARRVVEGVDTELRGYQVRGMYERVPAAIRTKIFRDLQRKANGAVVSQDAVVEEYLRRYR